MKRNTFCIGCKGYYGNKHYQLFRPFDLSEEQKVLRELNADEIIQSRANSFKESYDAGNSFVNHLNETLEKFFTIFALTYQIF